MSEELPQNYPPSRHVLRDLRLWMEPGGEPPRAGLTVVPPLLGPTGSLLLGALSVLVDGIAGGSALAAVRPDWIATSDMVVHLTGPVASGEVVACPRVARAGRGAVVVEVDVEAAGRRVALATVGFARLEARGEFQQRVPADERGARVSFAEPDSGLRVPFTEAIGARVVDAAAGHLELPITPYVGNSLGAVQGGVVTSLLDLAAQAWGAACLGAPVATCDLELRFLALGRQGPLCTRAELLRREGPRAVLRLELLDVAANRLCALGTAGVGPFG